MLDEVRILFHRGADREGRFRNRVGDVAFRSGCGVERGQTDAIPLNRLAAVQRERLVGAALREVEARHELREGGPVIIDGRQML